MNNTPNTSGYGGMPTINGSVNVSDGIKALFTENVKTPFITGAQTAQKQIANGTVLGGRIGVTQGYLTYTYLVTNPTNDIAYKVIIDAGNGQVLFTSDGKQIGTWDHSMLGSFEHGRGHEKFGGYAGFGPFVHGFGPFGGFWHNR